MALIANSKSTTDERLFAATLFAASAAVRQRRVTLIEPLTTEGGGRQTQAPQLHDKLRFLLAHAVALIANVSKRGWLRLIRAEQI